MSRPAKIVVIRAEILTLPQWQSANQLCHTLLHELTTKHHKQHTFFAKTPAKTPPTSPKKFCTKNSGGNERAQFLPADDTNNIPLLTHAEDHHGHIVVLA